jgi:GNAT superfamily N-acetyltransferase
MQPTNGDASRRPYEREQLERSIRRACPDDAHVATQILRSVSTWLAQRGCPLWEPESFDVGRFRDAALRGELVLGYEGPQAVACMLVQRSDPVFWPDALPEEALYLHKIAVLRRCAGRGWSARLIDWARAEARNGGARFLRLDTAPRPKLVTLYREHGFYVIDREPRRFGEIVAIRLEMEVSS